MEPETYSSAQDNGQAELLYQLRRSGRFIHHRVQGAGGQSRVLQTVYEHPGITQKELLPLLEVQPGSLSEMLTKLERRGFVERTRDSFDKRRVCVSLTEKGVSMIAGRDLDVYRQDLFKCLSREEQEQLMGILLKLNADWYERFIAPHVEKCQNGEPKPCE